MKITICTAIAVVAGFMAGCAMFDTKQAHNIERTFRQDEKAVWTLALQDGRVLIKQCFVDAQNLATNPVLQAQLVKDAAEVAAAVK